MLQSLQVTIPAGGLKRLSDTDLYCHQAVFQNNDAHDMRLGDSTTTATKGLKLAAAGAGSANAGPLQMQGINLLEWYVQGTPGEVLDFAIW